MHANVLDAVYYVLSNAMHVSASAELQLSADIRLGDAVCAGLGARFDYVVVTNLSSLSVVHRGLFLCLTILHSSESNSTKE